MSNQSLAGVFEESSDPHTYIPRRASEEILRCLSSLVRDGEPAVLLHGPAGIGKSMLLRVFGERLEGERRVVYISVSNSPEPELSHRILDSLAEPAADGADDPAQALIRAAATASAGHPRILLLIDHADLAPIASSLQLADAAQAACPHLTVVFAVADDHGAAEFARAISARVRVATLSFDQAMDPQEATAYVRLRLARTQIPAELRAQLDSRAIRWLSEGARAALPREINRRAAELLKSYEENGEEALHLTEPTTDSTPDREEPRVVDPAEFPADERIEPEPPAFPMQPGSAVAEDPAPASGAGSLGGGLLGHASAGTPKLTIDLELGRSLSSGLLESASPKKSAKDGGPVGPPPAEVAAESEQTDELESPVATSRAKRTTLLALASVIALAIGGMYVATRPPAVEEAAEGFNAADSTEAPATRVSAVKPAQIAAQIEPNPLDEPPVTEAAVPTAIAPEQSGTPDQRPSILDGPMLDTIVVEEEPKIEPVADTHPPLPPAPKPAASRPERRKPATNAPIILSSKSDGTEAAQPASYARLSIDVEAGSKVTIDGRSIGLAPFSEIFVEMGTHTFVAETPDGIVVEQMVDVQSGTDIIEF